MPKFSQNRTTPGLDQVGSINFGPKNQPASIEHIRTLPKKVACPFGIQDCRGCKIALRVDNKVECSISILAKNTLKEGFKVINKKDE